MCVLHAGISHKQANTTSNTEMDPEKAVIWIIALIVVWALQSAKNRK